MGIKKLGDLTQGGGLLAKQNLARDRFDVGAKTKPSSTTSSVAAASSSPSRPAPTPARSSTAPAPTTPTARSTRAAWPASPPPASASPPSASPTSAASSPTHQILEQVRRTLRFHVDKLPNDHGFFSHFNDLETGKPFGNSEVSSIDTAIFLCGALTARAHFHDDPKSSQLATTLYERVDWPWMLNGGKTFSMGLRHGKFLDARWNHYCELMMLYLLAIGSPTHPIDPAAWHAWSRPHIQYAGFDYIGASDPLFVHQYSHAWFDFRYQRDQFADYFANSILATRAHQAFCLALGKPYSDDYWGISASDSAHGYTAWGGPPRRTAGVDGSVVPYATAGSLPFTSRHACASSASLKDRYGKHAWGRYGFCDAFHPDANWYDPDVLGIDLGIGVLMAENLRTGFIWNTFAKNPEVAIAMQRAGFHKS